MVITRQVVYRLTALLLGFGALASPVLAGLSCPPSSHTEPTADGQHLLVFLAPLLPVEEGYVSQEDHDRTERLNGMYPASGCYEIGSTTPLWTAPWGFGIEWFVSEDCRYLVALNIVGDGQQRGGGGPDWGLKFYDSGKKIRTHNVSAQVDFPALMPLESSDWHNRWFGDSPDSCTIENGQLAREPLDYAANRYLRYRIRTLFVLTFIVAALCFATQHWPHVVVLLAFVVAAILLTRSTLRLHRGRVLKSSTRRRLLIAMCLSAASLAWFGCYVLSAGLVGALINWLDAPDDVRMAIGLTLYRPLIWASHSFALDDFGPLKWYFAAWHGH